VRRGHAAAVSGEGPGATDVRVSGAQRALCDNHLRNEEFISQDHIGDSR
jgi:hypothetical protein